MPRISIIDISAACQARPDDVRAALKIMGKPVFGNMVFFKSADEITVDLIREIETIRAMNAAQAQRHESQSPR